MKRLLTAIALLASVSANAHSFYPEEWTITAEPNSSFMMLTHLDTKEDGWFVFTIQDPVNPLKEYKMGDKQLVLAGSTVDFPLNIPSKFLKGDHVTVCSTQLVKHSTMQRKVCLKVTVL